MTLRSLPWRNIGLTIVLLVAIAAAAIFWPQRVDLSELASVGADRDVRILRDRWGVPHIYGATDADAAYGLAYAHAEDDFLTIQQSLLAARGRLATVYGKDAAPNDYMVQLLRIWDTVDARYDTDLSPETRAVMDAYADGINRYAALHPDEVLSAEVFPVTGKDVVAGSVHKAPLFFGLDNALGELFKETRQKEVSQRAPGAQRFADPRYGSNTMAVSPARSADGSTYLAVNSHQPWDGPVAWYEAHVHSEEGWDMVGGLFPGSPVIIHGHNRNLGWAFTVNHPDLTDIYVLEINPDNPNQYRFDGEWRDLEVRQAPITVKLLGRLRWTVKREVLWSVYGPVVRQPHGVYAIRYAGMGRVDLWQQLYRMNKARNFEEWQAAVRTRGLASFNVGYADRDGNIYYLYNGLLPVRAEGYDWSQYLPGNTSETLWTEYLPFDRLPQVLNPPSGFVQNANSTPFQTTVGAGNPDPTAYSPTLGIDDGMTNRAFRMRTLLSRDEDITFREFEQIKYDMSYGPESDVARYVQQLLEMPQPTDPDLLAGLELLRTWNLRADPDNLNAAVGILTLYKLADKNDDIKGSELVGKDVSDEELWKSFQEAVSLLKETYGRLDIPWKEVNRLVRGDVDVGIGGGPDLLHAVYGNIDGGRIIGDAGDSYVLLVRWDKDGQVLSRAIHQFGSATLDTTSPHYADQAPLFANRQLRPVWFEEADIRANLEAEYRPGER
jgi:penicillin amidase/acyl-homoserine-lactone acylase